MGATKKQTKLHHVNVQKREAFGFILRMIGFIQSACYASTMNKTNVRIIGEQNVHRSIFDLPNYYNLYK